MRAVYFALSAVALAAPAVASAQYRPAPEVVVADRLNDPYLQDRISDAMSGVLGAVLDFRIGEVERAIDPYSRAHPRETLRDRSNPYLEDDIRYQTQRTTRAMGAVADQAVIAMPALRDAIGRAIAGVDRSVRGYDDGYYDDRRPRTRD